MSIPPMDHAFDWAIVDRYFGGEASPEDRGRLDAWVAADPSRRAFWLALQEVHARATAVPTVWDVRPVMDRLLVRPDRGRVGGLGGGRGRLARVGWGGGFKAQPLRRIISAMFDGLTSRAVVALFGRKVTALTRPEIERLQRLIEQAETKDE